jgi:hypothetical protein
MLALKLINFFYITGSKVLVSRINSAMLKLKKVCLS